MLRAEAQARLLDLQKEGAADLKLGHDVDPAGEHELIYARNEFKGRFFKALCNEFDFSRNSRRQRLLDRAAVRSAGPRPVAAFGAFRGRVYEGQQGSSFGPSSRRLASIWMPIRRRSEFVTGQGWDLQMLEGSKLNEKACVCRVCPGVRTLQVTLLLFEE